jgi:hypothetical protein
MVAAAVVDHENRSGVGTGTEHPADHRIEEQRRVVGGHDNGALGSRGHGSQRIGRKRDSFKPPVEAAAKNGLGTVEPMHQ